MKKNSSGGTATQQEAAADEQKIATPATANVAPPIPGVALAASPAPATTPAATDRPDAVTLRLVTTEPKNAAGDKHAESSLAAQQFVTAEYQVLVAAVRRAEVSAGGKRDKAITDLVAHLEDEIDHICTADGEASGSWLDPEAKMDVIYALRAKVAEKRHTIARLTGSAELEAARENLRQFEEGHPLFAQRAPIGAAVPAKVDTAVKREAAKATVDALKPSLEARFPRATGEMLIRELAAAGFRWSGKPLRPLVAEDVEGAFAAWKGAKLRLEDADDRILAAYGWVREREKVEAPTPMAVAAVPENDISF